MEDLKNDFKIRGYRSCVSSAFYAVATNLRTLTLAHWRVFLILSVCISALSTWMQTIEPGAAYVGFELKRWQLMAAMTLFVVVNFVLSSALLAVINGRKLSWNVVRGLKLIPVNFVLFLIYIVLTCVCSFIYIRCNDNPAMIPLLNILAIAGLLLIVYFVIALPMAYVNMKYVMEPEVKIRKMFFRSYKTGMRSWGFIFVVVFLSSLCLGVADVAIGMPLYVMQLVYNISSIGMSVNGDNAGLPWYFMSLFFVISLCVTFVRIYLQLFLLYALYYVYQTIECKMKR